MTDTAEQSEWTPAQAAEAYAALGWQVIPIAPGRKHPQMPAWQTAATDDLATIRNWWTGLYQGHGVGVLTGERSGLWVLDVDIADGKPGDDNLTALTQRYGPLPITVEAETGTGGGHLLYTWDPARPITNGHAANLPPGLDIRGEGGQVVVAPTIHPCGHPYRWIEGRGPWDVTVATAPNWLYDLLLTQPVTEPDRAPRNTPPATPTGHGHTDSIADHIRNTYQWHQVLENDGWTLESTRGGDTHWTRPGKNTREGASAVLHEPDGPFVIFTSTRPTATETVGTDAKGYGRALSLFDYLAAYHYNGDRAALARAERVELNRATSSLWAPPKAPGVGVEVFTPNTPPTTVETVVGAPSAPDGVIWDPQIAPTWWDAINREVLRLKVRAEAQRVYDLDRRQTAHHDSQLVTGNTILDITPGIPTRWGDGDEVLWAQGEPFLLVAPPGVGKTTLMGQIVGGLLGIPRYQTVLKWPVTPASRVLYYASDRPRQILRSLRRHFTTEDLEALQDRLIIHRGPPPVDFARNPEALIESCRAVDADVVILDSLKDMAVGISTDDVGAGLNRAIQLAIAEGVDVGALHHQRKGQNGEKPKSLEDVYGSTWITAGAGSVVLLWGQAGDPVVELIHLKQPADVVGPMKIEHDHTNGVSSVTELFDPLLFLRNRRDTGATATETAKAWFGAADEAKQKKAKRKLDELVRRGLAVVSGGAVGGDGGSRGAVYRVVQNDVI